MRTFVEFGTDMQSYVDLVCDKLICILSLVYFTLSLCICTASRVPHRTKLDHFGKTPSDPYHTKSPGRGMEGDEPSSRFQGVGSTCAWRTGTPVILHSCTSTTRAGSAMKARSVGTIPSPLLPILPKRGKYELAATISSILVDRNEPSTPDEPTQVTSIPRSTRDSGEHSGDCSTSFKRPRV